MAGKPPPGIPGANGRAATLTFGQQRQSGGGGFGGNFNAGSSSGGGGNGAGFSQGGAQFGSGAGFGFNAGPPGNQINSQQVQGGSGNLGFPQILQGGQGAFPPQENLNAGGGFAGNAPRRGGQGGGNQRNFRNPNYRGGRPAFKARTSNNTKAVAGALGLDHSKSNLGEGSSNASTINDTQVEGKKKAKKESCYRCGSNGHLFFECTAILCEYCEQVGHNLDDCHLLSAPKPYLILHGISDEKLMFFELVPDHKILHA
jgi:hypothetical protein